MKEKVNLIKKLQIKNGNNIISINSPFSNKNFIYSKKLIILLFIIFAAFLLLIIRIGYLQFFDNTNLKELAYKQQTINQIISPKRGNIYDTNRQVFGY